MSRRPTLKLHSKMNTFLHSFNERRFETEKKSETQQRPRVPTRSKRKMEHYMAGKDTRQTNRLQIAISCGLWPENKPEPTYVF